MLDEDMMGRDPAVVGFPHLLVCMGFVARTNADLWGVHLTTVVNSPGTFAAFWTWAQTKGLGTGAITDIYGSGNHRVRYGTNTAPAGWGAWNVEMQGYANHMGWNGPAHGFDTSIINPQDGTYVEYQLQLAGAQPCTIFYKRNEKTVPTGTTTVNYAGGAGDVAAWDHAQNRFRGMAFPKTGVIGRVSTFHKGTFHELDYALRMRTVAV
jgi:hypothetical protein